jgi:hypothetical protein
MTDELGPTADGSTRNNDGPPLSLASYLPIYNVYRDYVMQESNLINTRLMWILTINGFLFTTFGLSLQKQLEITRYVAKDGIDNSLLVSVNAFHASFYEIQFFLFVICVIGVLVSLLGRRSILAAQMASHAVADLFANAPHRPHTNSPYLTLDKKEVRSFQTCEGYLLPDIRGGGNARSVNFGHGTSKWIPLILALAWAILAISGIVVSIIGI